MRRACALAARGIPTAAPNPVVGCVILASDGRIVGEGWHDRPGGPHAEVAALHIAGAAARGGTAVVTLEPCRHTGRTGPCTRALLDAGVTRVVYAVADPSALAGGGGAELAAAGIQVESGLLAEEAETVNAAWLFVTRTGRPVVTWKYAATLDGRAAAVDGTSRWITGPEARSEVHRLRGAHDAVLAGVGTVLADDAALTARGPDGRLLDRQPLRVVVDSRGRTPATARVRDASAPTWVATAEEVGSCGGRVDLHGLLRGLVNRGVLSAFLEGGPTLAAAFLRVGLVDRVVGYVAPALLGSGPAVLGDLGVGTIAGIARLELDGVARVGPDVRLVLRTRPDAPPLPPHVLDSPESLRAEQTPTRSQQHRPDQE